MRYTLAEDPALLGDPEMVEYGDGEWIKYSDYAALREALETFAERVEGDRRESDKILCHVQSLRAALAQER